MQNEKMERVRNDDYETIVFKVLLHQYGLLKRKITFEADTFDRYIDKENIAPGYFADALHMMQDDYLIEGLTFGQAWGKDMVLTSDLENARITSMGIYHLTGDETMIKLRERAYTTPGLASVLVKLVMPE